MGYSHISQTGEVAARLNFPLQLSPGAELDGRAHDDSASLMQSLVELTQVMTNAHDILYPSKLRTEVLVKQGEYFLFLDHFRRGAFGLSLLGTVNINFLFQLLTATVLSGNPNNGRIVLLKS